VGASARSVSGRDAEWKGLLRLRLGVGWGGDEEVCVK